MEPEIGRVEWLDIRAVWKNEAADFTPWLLKNVDVLRDALGGLDLELERAEHPVGSFSLDLIGTDLTNGVPLIVENQIEASDHRHLGQLLTYTAGTDAGTIVWMTTGFRDEHRLVLDWLNEHTGEDVRFFGVVVRALRVGDSAAAPMLDVVAQPNDWQKTVRRVAEPQLTEQHAAYRAFWGPLRERLLEENPDLLRKRSVPKWTWLTINSPIPRTSIAGEIRPDALWARVDITTLDRQRNLDLLEELRRHRAVLEEEVSGLEFEEYGKQSCVVVRREPWEGRLLTQPERHEEARAWFYANMLGLRRGLEAVVPLISPTFFTEHAAPSPPADLTS